jgi:hypothetical protein
LHIRRRNDRVTERLQFQPKRENEQNYNGVWTVGPDQVEHAAKIRLWRSKSVCYADKAL